MKKVILSSIVILLSVISCTTEKRSPIEGAWRLAYEYRVTGDSVVTLFPVLNSGSEMKMWSEHNFIFVGKFVQDTLTVDNFGGGSYTLEGNRYEETVEFHSAPEYLGKKVKLHLEIKNDTLTQKWPVDDNGQVDKNLHFMEKWVRIK